MRTGTGFLGVQLCGLQAGAPQYACSHCAGCRRQLWFRCSKPRHAGLRQGLQCADPRSTGCKGLPWCKLGQAHRHASSGRQLQYTCPCSAKDRAAGLALVQAGTLLQTLRQQAVAAVQSPMKCWVQGLPQTQSGSDILHDSQPGTILHPAEGCWVRRLALVQACRDCVLSQPLCYSAGLQLRVDLNHLQGSGRARFLQPLGHSMSLAVVVWLECCSCRRGARQSGLIDVQH